MRKNSILFLLSLFFFNSVSVWALQPAPMSYRFPIHHYSQTITDWIKPDRFSDKPLLSSVVQKKQMENFKNHFLLSWNDSYIAKVLNSDLPTALNNVLKSFDRHYTCTNDKKQLLCSMTPKDVTVIGRGVCDAKKINTNTPYPDSWIQDLAKQVNISQFNGKNSVQGKAIALDNLHMRALPTDDHYFYDCNLPGEGDSFDYLQTSALWAGTPVYILGESTDHQWYLVHSPDAIGWVKSAGIKRVSNLFIAKWMDAVNKEQSLVAINSPNNTKTLFIFDEATHTKRFIGYIGAVFPVDPSAPLNETGFSILIPIKEAELPVTAYVAKQDANLIPLLLTPTYFLQVINKLKGRSYGWGGLNIENPSTFLNDCSQELKSLYTPFGIWLPRHSADQVDAMKMLGTVVDLKSYSPEERIAKLMSDGEKHRFATIIYIGGHVLMYLGNYANPTDDAHAVVALTYQNIWGLRPVDGIDADGNPLPSGRYVIGKSVLFPLLVRYPEKYPYPFDRELNSQATRSFFTVAYLDQLPSSLMSMSLRSYLGLGSSKLNPNELYALMQILY